MVQEQSLPEYISWYLKSNGLTIVDSKKFGPKIVPKKEPKEVLERRELEQTHELLVGLTQELFNRIEKLESEGESKIEEVESKGENKIEEVESKEESKIVFSDLTWYRNKLENTKK